MKLDLKLFTVHKICCCTFVNINIFFGPVAALSTVPLVSETTKFVVAFSVISNAVLSWASQTLPSTICRSWNLFASDQKIDKRFQKYFQSNLIGQVCLQKLNGK